ncbi:5-methyltetrahydropteroyltriglutamate-homocysteine S-methyltransferase [Rhizoctonia solani]|uniref:5-methyltetrahydropteroyltriglutamate-homocysteine S-methyltransferase n=1 Tax=Rhizoctonia solani TaxID=456999 RepID=A0A8H7H3X1_9AGAM|nr:5-methyltetrahydropteroyltriglutamate-homocysteine S-methyltransferase [Rhizoctonia solani]
MPIPCEVVGSIPRPLKLQRAFAAYEARQITFEQLEPEINHACEDTIRRMEDAGQLVITDGEQRISSFATYPIFEWVIIAPPVPSCYLQTGDSTLHGTGLAENLVLDGHGQMFAIFADGHERRLPRLVSGPFRFKTFAADYMAQGLHFAQNLVKQAVVAPSMLSLLYPLKSEIPGYTREQFLADLCDQCETDIRKCFQAGAVRVSIDFTEGRLALRNDSRNPWTGERLLDFFLELNNRVINRFTAVERAHIGVHTCPGGDWDSTHSLDVPYELLLKEMFRLKDRNKVFKLIGKHIRRDANGVKQMAYIGVTSTIDPRVESPEEIAQMLVAATKYIPADQLGATDDCGFSPFCDDKKP